MVYALFLGRNIEFLGNLLPNARWSLRDVNTFVRGRASPMRAGKLIARLRRNPRLVIGSDLVALLDLSIGRVVPLLHLFFYLPDTSLEHLRKVASGLGIPTARIR